MTLFQFFQQMYLLFSALLYVFSIYQNVLVCLRFYKNITSIHKYLDTIKKYITSGFSVQLEKDFGKNSNIDDNELQRLGAKILNKEEIYKTSDIIVKINCPSDSEILLIKEGAVLIGSFFPYLNKDRINKLLKRNIKIFSF